jgi:hypothetical protein
MIRRLAAVTATVAFACAAHGQDAAKPIAHSHCEALDAGYAMAISKLDQAVDAAVAVAKKEPSERNWAKALEAQADLVASEVDYKALHTQQACSSQRFALPEPWEREPPTDRNVKPFLLQFTNSAATAAGIGVLKDAALPEGEKEIRIWIGFGIIEPNAMLRMRVDSSGTVTGDVLLYFSHDYGRRILDGSTAGEALEMWSNVVRGCGEVREGAVDDACFVKHRRQIDWRAVHASLLNLGLESLPDQDDLPDDNVEVFDGVAMVVEVRQGAHYRAYHYSNPGFHEQPEAQAAMDIIKAASDTIRSLQLVGPRGRSKWRTEE